MIGRRPMEVLVIIEEPSRRFPRSFHDPDKNCVAYHFRPWFGHVSRPFSRKEKSRECCGSLLYGSKLEPLVRLRVVLVLVDTLAHVIRFAIEMALVLLGQMAVVLRHVFLFIVLQALFTALQAPGFSRSKLATLNAVGNAILLVLFALIHLIDARMTRIDLAGSGARGVVLLRSSGSDKHQATRRKN
jgi:hypothetical protein